MDPLKQAYDAWAFNHLRVNKFKLVSRGDKFPFVCVSKF